MSHHLISPLRRNNFAILETGEPITILHRSPGITTIYNELKSSNRNRVLDLSSASQASFAFFSQLSCHIHFESLDDFLVESGALLTSGASLKEGLSRHLSTFNEASFDIILAWDIFNYLDAETLLWLMSQLNRHSHSNTLLHMIKYVGRQLPAAPRHHQILDQHQLKLTCSSLLCSRPFASLDTTKMLKNMPGYTMEQSFMNHEGMTEGIAEHVLRFEADKKNNKRQIASTGLVVGDQLLKQTLPHRSYGLEKICHFLQKKPKTTILNLGSKSTHTSDFFQDYAAQIYAEDIVPSLLTPEDPSSDLSLRQHALSYEDTLTFDIILVWDLFNFCSRTQLNAICAKLRPHMHARTQLLAMFYAGSETPERPQKYYILDDQNLAFLPTPKQQRVVTEITPGAVLKALGDFHLAQSYILRPRMQRGIYEYVFQAGVKQ